MAATHRSLITAGAALIGAALVLVDGYSASATPTVVAETYPATVTSVIDGDSFHVSIPTWPAPFRAIEVRVAGIDTPEHEKPPAKKACEVKLGLAASAFAKTILHPGDQVSLTWSSKVGNDKYFRLLADVKLADGRDYSDLLIASGKARAYDGGTKLPWC